MTVQKTSRQITGKKIIGVPIDLTSKISVPINLCNSYLSMAMPTQTKHYIYNLRQ